VHVVTPADPDVEQEPTVPVTDKDKAMVILSLIRTPAPTICGYEAVVYMHPSVHTDNFVTVFADELLCGRCHRALGEHANRAFEHRVP
jgi:hypothetical protein